MAEEAIKRCAVVTGANKGIGFATCKLLASKGITVALTARDEKKGLEAVEKLRELGLSGHVVFHQLDVTDPASIASLAHFINTKFGKLDILVNNAGTNGAVVDGDALAASGIEKGNINVDWSKIVTQTHELAEAAVKTNYHGAKEISMALTPLLQLSNSPRIVNVSSIMATFEFLPNGWAKEVFRDIESLTIEKIDDIMSEFLKDFNEGSLETKGWPISMSAYSVSKAALHGYTRIMARTYPSFCINVVCPGYVKTDMTQNCGLLSPDEGAQAVVRLALLPNSPSGLFFLLNEERPF